MKHIVYSNEKYLIVKTYQLGEHTFSKIIGKTSDLREAVKLAEDAVPANSVGGGGISGLDIGIVKKKKKPKVRKWTF